MMTSQFSDNQKPRRGVQERDHDLPLAVYRVLLTVIYGILAIDDKELQNTQ